MSDLNKPEKGKQEPPVPGDECLREIWEKLGEAEEQNPVSSRELDDAWQQVRQKSGMDEPGNAVPLNENIWLCSKYAVAAVALFVLGAYLLFVPKTVTVSHGEIAAIDLPDGSVAELNSGTEIRYYRFFRGDERRVMLNGEAHFSVAGGEKPFIVEAGETVTEVTGTKFNLRSWSDEPLRETRLEVLEGDVRFYIAGRPGQDPVRVSAGELSRWSIELDRPSDPEPVSIDDISAWRDNRLVFRNRTVLSILNDLERRYNLQISLEAAVVADETLTVYYREPQPITAVLNDISSVKELRYAETANGYRLFRE